MADIGQRKLINTWVKQAGRLHVCAKLIEGGVAPSTADQLSRNKYPQEPTGKTREKIDKVLSAFGRAKSEAS